MMVSSNCQKHSKAWNRGRERAGGGRDGRGSNASIALLAGSARRSTASAALSTKRQKRTKEGEKEGARHKEGLRLHRSACPDPRVIRTSRCHIAEVLQELTDWSSLDSLRKYIFRVIVYVVTAQRKGVNDSFMLQTCEWAGHLWLAAQIAGSAILWGSSERLLLHDSDVWTTAVDRFLEKTSEGFWHCSDDTSDTCYSGSLVISVWCMMPHADEPN